MFSRKAKKPGSNLERILSEFPWLWAVRQQWVEPEEGHFLHISAGDANLHFLKFGILGRRGSFKQGGVWIVSRSGKTTSIDQVNVVEYRQWFTDQMFEARPDETFQITHLVLDSREWNQVQIFRMPPQFDPEHVSWFSGNY
ncbi:MAG: hypothetical protein AB203_02610 [Parcubacteria bacterium C7867-008]|nr:MAG: hypothetical protein AB203_02610 [Parcubacteria bacterium C7867-008]